MKRNDWNMKPDEYHWTVLGVLKRRWLLSDHPEKAGQRMGCWLVGSTGRRSQRGEDSRDAVIREIRETGGIDASQAGYAFSYKR